MRAEDVPQAWAIMAGAEVLANLFDRRGIKQALWEIDEDTLNELRETIGRLALAAVAPLIRAAALEEAAELADTCDSPLACATQEQDEAAAEMADRIAAAIRAMKEPTT